MRVRLDPSSSSPLSAQLRDRIAAGIEGGRLLPGHRMPPVRTLATDLRLAPNTVAKAYRELEAAGLLVARGRHGTFVADRLPERPATAEALLDAAAAAYAARARQLGASTQETVRAVREAMAH